MTDLLSYLRVRSSTYESGAPSGELETGTKMSRLTQTRPTSNDCRHVSVHREFDPVNWWTLKSRLGGKFQKTQVEERQCQLLYHVVAGGTSVCHWYTVLVLLSGLEDGWRGFVTNMEWCTSYLFLPSPKYSISILLHLVYSYTLVPYVPRKQVT